MLDSRRITGRSAARGLPQRISRRLAVDVRWLGTSAALVLALLAGVMAGMVLADHSRVTLAWVAVLAAVLAGAIGCLAMVAVRDADVLWESRKDAAIARGDAELAQRRADACRADDLRSRELLQRLQVATTDAMRDPFLADRLARGPRDEQDLLVAARPGRPPPRQPPGRVPLHGTGSVAASGTEGLRAGVATTGKARAVRLSDQSQTSISCPKRDERVRSRDPRAFRARNVLGSDPRNAVSGVRPQCASARGAALPLRLLVGGSATTWTSTPRERRRTASIMPGPARRRARERWVWPSTTCVMRWASISCSTWSVGRVRPAAQERAAERLRQQLRLVQHLGGGGVDAAVLRLDDQHEQRRVAALGEPLARPDQAVRRLRPAAGGDQHALRAGAGDRLPTARASAAAISASSCRARARRMARFSTREEARSARGRSGPSGRRGRARSARGAPPG